MPIQLALVGNSGQTVDSLRHCACVTIGGQTVVCLGCNQVSQLGAHEDVVAQPVAVQLGALSLAGITHLALYAGAIELAIRGILATLDTAYGIGLVEPQRTCIPFVFVGEFLEQVLVDTFNITRPRVAVRVDVALSEERSQRGGGLYVYVLTPYPVVAVDFSKTGGVQFGARQDGIGGLGDELVSHCSCLVVLLAVEVVVGQCQASYIAAHLLLEAPADTVTLQ